MQQTRFLLTPPARATLTGRTSELANAIAAAVVSLFAIISLMMVMAGDSTCTLSWSLRSCTHVPDGCLCDGIGEQ